MPVTRVVGIVFTALPDARSRALRAENGIIVIQPSYGRGKNDHEQSAYMGGGSGFYEFTIMSSYEVRLRIVHGMSHHDQLTHVLQTRTPKIIDIQDREAG